MKKHLRFYKVTTIILLFAIFLILTVPMAIELGVKFKLSWLRTLSIFLAIPVFIATTPTILSQQHIKRLYCWLSNSPLFIELLKDSTLYLIISIMFLSRIVSDGLVLYFLFKNPGATDLDFFTMPFGGLYLWYQIMRLIPIVIGIIYFGTRGFLYFIEKIGRDSERILLGRIAFVLVCIMVAIQVML